MSHAHREYFNRLAQEWDAKVCNQETLRPLLEMFKINPGDRVLDLGCGTGRTTRLIREMVAPGGTVIALDLAEDMLKMGKMKFQSKAVTWICADGEQTSLKNNSVDKVLCFSSFPHFQNPEKLIQEMYRILRPMGRFLILHTADHIALNAFHRCLEGPVSTDQLPPAQVLAANLIRNGFLTLAVEEREGHYWVEGEKGSADIRTAGK